MGGEHHAKTRPADALPELLEGDRLRGLAGAGEIVDQRTQALQIGSAPGLAQIAAQALRPTRQSLGREPLDQLLDHRRRERAGIHSLLDRQGEQLDGIARRVGVSAPAQARQGGLQLGQQRIDRIVRRRRRRLFLERRWTRLGIQDRHRPGLASLCGPVMPDGVTSLSHLRREPLPMSIHGFLYGKNRAKAMALAKRKSPMLTLSARAGLALDLCCRPAAARHGAPRAPSRLRARERAKVDARRSAGGLGALGGYTWRRGWRWTLTPSRVGLICRAPRRGCSMPRRGRRGSAAWRASHAVLGPPRPPRGKNPACDG